MSFMSTVHEVEFSLEILNLIHFQSKCYSNLENKYLTRVQFYHNNKIIR